MNQLRIPIKDLEAVKHGIDLDVELPRDFFQHELHDVEVKADQSAAHLTAHVQHFTGGNVVLRGRLTATLATECVRCLAPTQVPVDTRLQMTFVPTGTELPAGSRIIDPNDPDDIDYGHHDRTALDLVPVVREQLILGLPMTILCREDCRGLCPVCGGDRNQQPCQCQPLSPTSPFAVLKNLTGN